MEVGDKVLRIDNTPIGSQFTCFNSTKGLALLVQKYKYCWTRCSASMKRQQVLNLLALLVQILTHLHTPPAPFDANTVNEMLRGPYSSTVVITLENFDAESVPYTITALRQA